MKYKLYKYVLGMFVLTFLLTGCDKNEDQLATIVSQKSEIGYVVRDGYLAFDCKESFIATINLISNLNSLERCKWENKIGFHSQQSIVNNLINEELIKDSLNRVKYANTDLSKVNEREYHSETYYKVLSKGIIKILNENTSDEYWDYSSFNRGFTCFTNEEGLFAVGDSLFQVTDSKLKVIKISSESNKINLLKALNNTDEEKTSHISTIQKTQGTSPGLKESDWVRNSRWPKASQRIKLGVELTCLYFTPYTAKFDFKYNFYVQCQKTNVFNNWIYYGAPVTVNGSWTMLAYYFPQRYSNHVSYSSSPSYLQASVNPETGDMSSAETTFSILPNSANESYIWEFQNGYQPLFETYSWTATRTDVGLTASLTY